MKKIGCIGHGISAFAVAANEAGLMSEDDMAKVQICNMSEDEIAKRDKPVSRQMRRQAERLLIKGRSIKGE